MKKNVKLGQENIQNDISLRRSKKRWQKKKGSCLTGYVKGFAFTDIQSLSLKEIYSFSSLSA